jgi:tocopherol O-methyltransferase
VAPAFFSRMAEKKNVSHLVKFEQKDYTATGYEPAVFDIVWAIESLGSAPDKALFFKEMNRVLKTGGKILFADTFKPTSKSITSNSDMQTMLNGWAITDILSITELKAVASQHGFLVEKIEDVSPQIKKSVNKIYAAAWLGRIGTKLYTLFKNATPFSKIHYKTGLAQKKTFDRGDWGYYLVCLRKE